MKETNVFFTEWYRNESTIRVQVGGTHGKTSPSHYVHRVDAVHPAKKLGPTEIC